MGAGCRDEFQVLPDEKRRVKFQSSVRTKSVITVYSASKFASLENLFENMGKGAIKDLNIILKTDVRGSLEALSAALMDLGTVKFRFELSPVVLGYY